MEGDEVSVEGIVHGDAIHLIAITDKSPLQGPFFIESGDRMPSLHSDEVQQQIMEVPKKWIRALGYMK